MSVNILIDAIANLYKPSRTPKEEMYIAFFHLAEQLYDESEDLVLQVAAISEILEYVTYKLPTTLIDTRTPPTGYAPIASFFPNLAEVILVAVAPVIQNKKVFRKLRKQMQPRFLAKPIDQSKGDLIAEYLSHTPFADFFNTLVPFSIPLKTFASHGVVLAPPNFGKSQFLGSLIHGFLTAPEPCGVVVLDPHGDLFETLSHRIDPKRLIILDPDTDPPALNFLDFGNSSHANTLQTFSYLMASLAGGMTDKQSAVVPYLLKLIKLIPDASIVTLSEIVGEKLNKKEPSQFQPYIDKLPPIDQNFFATQFHNPSMQVTKDAIGWKLYSALSSDAFREMFSAKTNSFSFDDAFDKVVLIKGGRDALGDDGMRVFLQFMIAQYFSAGLRRAKIPIHDRKLCVMLVDEAHMVMNSPIISNILTELRKYACGFIAATQLWHQIGEDVKAAVLGATAIKIVGSVSSNDAMVLAREMYCDAPFIRALKSYERSHAEWACHVSNLTPHAVKLSVPFGAVDKLPQTDALTYQAFRNANRLMYGAHEKVKKPEVTPQNIPEPPRTNTSDIIPDTDY